MTKARRCNTLVIDPSCANSTLIHAVTNPPHYIATLTDHAISTKTRVDKAQTMDYSDNSDLSRQLQTLKKVANSQNSRRMLWQF